MTHPISYERLEWLSRRLIVVEKTLTIAKNWAHGATGMERDDLLTLIRSQNVERMGIQIEMHVLKETLDVQA